MHKTGEQLGNRGSPGSCQKRGLSEDNSTMDNGKRSQFIEIRNQSSAAPRVLTKSSRVYPKSHCMMGLHALQTGWIWKLNLHLGMFVSQLSGLRVSSDRQWGGGVLFITSPIVPQLLNVK